MADERKRKRRMFAGAVGHTSPAIWVQCQLATEELDEAEGATGPSQPVSVRLDGPTIALLDALATRFRVSRSAFLVMVIQGGVSEAFQAMGTAEQDAMLESLKGKVRASQLVHDVDPDNPSKPRDPSASPDLPPGDFRLGGGEHSS